MTIKKFLEIQPHELNATHRQLGPFYNVHTFQDGWRKWFWMGHAPVLGGWFLKVVIGPFATENQAARAWDHCREEQKTAPRGWWRRLFSKDASNLTDKR